MKTQKYILFDMDGVLASVGNSYPEAIVQVFSKQSQVVVLF